MKRIFAIIVALCFLATLSASAVDMDLKFTCATPDGHHATMGLQKFCQLLTERTNGRITGTVYIGGQLTSGEREIMEALQFGTADVAYVSTGILPAYDERFKLFTLPYLFRDVQNVYNTCDGPIGDELKQILNDKAGVVLLGWFISGIHTITTSNRPINKMSDLKGLKLRCMENPLITEAWKAYGAVPTPMSVGEVFTALQQGTIDGQDNGTANSYANKYYEVQKYLCMTEHMIVPQVLVMSQEKFDAVPADLKAIFDQCVVDAVKFQREEYGRQELAAVDNMKARGMEVCYPDKEEFRKAAAVVVENVLKSMDKTMTQWVEDIRTKY